MVSFWDKEDSDGEMYAVLRLKENLGASSKAWENNSKMMGKNGNLSEDKPSAIESVISLHTVRVVSSCLKMEGLGEPETT